MEEDLKLTEKLTRNMINLILRRYDDPSTPYMQYDLFVQDLDVLEQANPTAIRIFKT